MKTPDNDRARSEEKHTLAEFLTLYNENLPAAFPHATAPLLRRFKNANPALFRDASAWSLDQHRKKVMDWLPQALRAAE